MIKFTPQMLDVIKNFNLITSAGLAFTEGNKLIVQDGNKLTGTGTTMVAAAELEQSITRGFLVADPIQFYSALSAFQRPNITLDSGKIRIEDESSTGGVFYLTEASPTIVKPTTEPAFPEAPENITFTLSAEQGTALFRGVGTVQAELVAIIGHEGALTVEALQPNNKTSDSYKMQIGHTSQSFRFLVGMTSLAKLMRNVNYQVTVSLKGVVRFKSDGPFTLTYYIAAETEV